MTAPAFVAAQQTFRLINRDNELKKLRQAICDPGSDPRVVIIKSPGGWGKTRLLMEALWRAGHPGIFPQRDKVDSENEWGVQERVIVSGVLDFSESRLHLFDKFMERLRQSFDWHPRVEFPKYDAALSTYRRRSKDHVDFSAIQIAFEQSHTTFFEDYQRLAQAHRLVWALDTLEQLRYPGAPWLKEKGLLTGQDLDFSTRERLLSLLASNQLPNTTILLAGRPGAEDYFTELAHLARKNFTVEIIDLTVFSLADTKNYLQQLEQDYTQEPTRSDFNQNVADALKLIAADEDRISVLHQFTGGKPVLLALFTDLLVEGKEEPEALRLTPAEARERLQSKSLDDIQFDIEADFINLIFAKTGDLRSRILTALVRARRGLTLDQLEFILGSQPGQKPETWTPNRELRDRIAAELDEKNPFSLRYLSFVKSGFGERLILQDELYRIYDDHMARHDRSRQDETLARTALYRQLHVWAKAQIVRLREERNQKRRQDEDSLAWTSPAKALTSTFRYLGQIEEEARLNLEEQLQEAELERLYYKLRLDPGEGIFDWYTDNTERRLQTGTEAGDLQGQIELWRFAQYNPTEEAWRSFIDIPPENWPVLERIIAADDVIRWFKRFFIRGEYQRALEFIAGVESALPALTDLDRAILNHPFFHNEIISWREFAQTYLSQDIEDNIANLKKVIQNISDLLKADFPEKNEFGLSPQTARTRLRRTQGVAYNNLGYSYTTLGRYREASQAYAEAERYLRDTGFLSMQANVRNNLSRVLSELGLITRAERVCRDGLGLRERLGYEAPIAVSHSTLALIYNNGMQPENAWVEAAMAVAYFRKLQNRRGHGLALHHLAEALRRLATSPRPKQDRPEQLFETAMEAIDQAVEIFTENPEVMRLVEVYIEQGCLYRDYTRYLKRQGYPQFADYIDRAIKPLNRAVALAQEMGLPRHQLDALVNLAWAYYYAEKPDEAEATFETTLKFAATLQKENCFLKKGQQPPPPTNAEPHVFMLLGKVWAVRARMSMDRFLQRQAEFKELYPEDRSARVEAVHKDEAAQRSLQEAAEAFVLALGYNELYSIRSPYISVVFDRLYAYLKGFNTIELQDFYKYQAQARAEYRVAEITPEDVTDMEVFLRQSFGDYYEPLPGSQEVDS